MLSAAHGDRRTPAPIVAESLVLAASWIGSIDGAVGTLSGRAEWVRVIIGRRASSVFNVGGRPEAVSDVGSAAH